MDKDIHDIDIDGEKIEGIVYDDNDTDAKSDTDLTEEAKENDTLNAQEEDTTSTKDKVADVKTEDDSIKSIDSKENESDGVSEQTDNDLVTDTIDSDYKPSLLEKRKRKFKNIRLAICVPSILIIIAGMITLFIIAERNEKYDNLLNVDYFYEGVYIDDIALGGLTLDEAKDAIEAANKVREDNVSIALDWEGEKITFTKEDVNISFNSSEVLEKAWQEGRSGEDKKRYDYVLSLIDNPIRFTTDIDIELSQIEAKVKAIALFRQSEPGEASVKFDPDPETDGTEWFEYSEPEKGVNTDPDALWETVVDTVANSPNVEIEIPKWEIDPITTIDDLKNMTQLIVQFQSTMVRSSNREHNVRLACSMINGTVLMPGEIFSMNDTTGKRTKAAGYKEANVIVSGNQLVPGIAGGVCQVSGTLFNAALRADLEIVERHHHSFELSYLTRGRDATVNYGTADLRFKNTTDHPIYISMYTIDREVYAEIYGVPLDDGMTIGLYVKTTQTVAPGPTVYVADSSIPTWESPKTYSARTGIKCTTYKDYYDVDGKLIDRVELYSDYYRPFPMEVHYNPAVGRPG